MKTFHLRPAFVLLVPFVALVLTSCATTTRSKGKAASADVAEARKAVEAFFAGFNARDDAAVKKSLNYPHIRLASGNVRIYETAKDYATGFKQLTETEGWHHSTLDSIVSHQSDPNKVHFEIKFSRYKEDGTKYGVYDSLWIVTKIEGHWGVQCRSSFAP